MMIYSVWQVNTCASLGLPPGQNGDSTIIVTMQTGSRLVESEQPQQGKGCRTYILLVQVNKNHGLFSKDTKLRYVVFASPMHEQLTSSYPA